MLTGVLQVQWYLLFSTLIANKSEKVLEKQVATLRREVEALKIEISEMKILLQEDPHPPDKNNIPQYDGPSSPIDSGTVQETNSMESFDCEFCAQSFETKEGLKEHNRAHEFCCEECLIRYNTQLESDLHELELHPGTHYANNYISQSSKILFAKNKGIIL